MRVIHDNFGSLPANARVLAPKKNDEELSNLLSCKTIPQGGKLLKIQLSLASIEEKKKEVDPGTLVQLRQAYLICI